MDKRGMYTLTEEKLVAIAVMYGIQITKFGPVEGGYRNVSHNFVSNDGRNYNFILYKREPGSIDLIKRTNALGAHIAAKGLPVRTPADERILRVGQRFGSLYGYLEGSTIPWEAYTMKHIKLLGFAMAKFHAAGAQYNGPSLPDVEKVYMEIAGRMERYFADENVMEALRSKLQLDVRLPNFTSLLQVAQKLPDRTPLHMDFVRSNVLFREAHPRDMFAIGSVTLSGILDLEKAAVGHPLFDVARTLAFLLVDCAKPTDKIYKYFLYSGYMKRGGTAWKSEHIHQLFRSGSLGSIGQFVSPRCAGNAQPSQNSRCTCSEVFLEQLVTLFLTYDFYKFLKQNPYESLPKNHHFKRTVDILLARKVLHYSD